MDNKQESPTPETPIKHSSEEYNERSLHPLLVSFASNPKGHFGGASLKTIFHEKSSRKAKGENEWLHPDLVGVHFMASDWSE